MRRPLRKSGSNCRAECQCDKQVFHAIIQANHPIPIALIFPWRDMAGGFARRSRERALLYILTNIGERPSIHRATKCSAVRERALAVETVLVLEDEPISRKVIVAILRAKGFNVLETTTAAEAIEAGRWHRGSLDLLVADIILPDKSGAEAAGELFAVWPGLKVLFISGTPFEGLRPKDVLHLHQLPREAWEFLSKPFRASALDREVRKLLNRARAFHAAGAEYRTYPDTMSRTTREKKELLRVAASVSQPTLISNESEKTSRNIPAISFCEERTRLSNEFLRAIHDLNELHAQQTRAVVDGDPDFARFDVLIHMAAEKKQEAKYVLIRHMESHGCQEG
ncbi:MAG: hypothetical protein C5B51_28890 [Terriglobia bacterium]|nr:MAG: hypothetical protein C5B51_28890 [Terriglobia bacterium]